MTLTMSTEEHVGLPTDPFTALLHAGRAIAAATSVGAVRQAVQDALPVVLGAEHCYIVEVHGAEPVPVTTETGQPVVGLSTSIIREAIATGRVVSVLSVSPPCGEVPPEVRSALCAAISRSGRVVSCFYVTRSDREFGPEEERVAALIAALAGATLEHVAGSEAQFRALVRNSHDITIVCDASGRALYISPSVNRILGYAPLKLLAHGLVGLDLVHPDDQEHFLNAFRLARFSPATRPTCEFRARHHDGSWRWLEVTMSNLLADPSIRGLVLNIRDVTERRAAEERLTFLALHDPLTGLANRRLLLDRLSVALARAARSGQMVAVLYLDLDRFKSVNDTLGHEQGDELLVQAASRLGELVRDSDTVARLGGDEFVVVVDDLADSLPAAAIARRIEDSLNQPFDLPGGERVSISASVGVAVAHGDADPAHVVRRADAAMYEAKERGRAISTSRLQSAV